MEETTNNSFVADTVTTADRELNSEFKLILLKELKAAFIATERERAQRGQDMVKEANTMIDKINAI